MGEKNRTTNPADDNGPVEFYDLCDERRQPQQLASQLILDRVPDAKQLVKNDPHPKAHSAPWLDR